MFRTWQSLIGSRHVLTVPFTFMAFYGAMVVALRSANIVVFEHAIIWLAFLCLVRGRPLGFTILVAFAGAVKLLPLAFLVLLPIVYDKRGWQYLAASLSIVAALYAATWLVSPAAFDRWLQVLLAVEERGSLNPSSLSLLKSTARFVARTTELHVSNWSVAIAWCLFATIVVALALRNCRRRGETLTRDPVSQRDLVLFATLTCAIALPRFKDYSFVMLIPAACATAYRMRGWVAGTAILVVCALPLELMTRVPFEPAAHLMSYYPFLLASLLWVTFVGSGNSGTIRSGNSGTRSRKKRRRP
jgi:hypothetical protein